MLGFRIISKVYTYYFCLHQNNDGLLFLVRKVKNF